MNRLPLSIESMSYVTFIIEDVCHYRYKTTLLNVSWFLIDFHVLFFNSFYPHLHCKICDNGYSGDILLITCLTKYVGSTFVKVKGDVNF